MEKSETIKELATALSIFQGELKPALKSETNPFFKSTYADLASVWDAIREPLAKNGLSVTQTLGNDLVKDNILIVETTLLHSSGEWVASKWCMAVPVRTTYKKDNQGNILSTTETLNDPQSVGSVISYARRYSISAILGVASEDDDAESATGHKKVKTESISEPPQLSEKSGQLKEHWCAEHNTAFLKTEKMKSFSHPVKDKFDEKGKQVWCNEVKKQPAEVTIEGVVWPEDGENTRKVAAPPSVTSEKTAGAFIKSEPAQPETKPSPGGINIDEIIEQMISNGLDTAGKQKTWLVKYFSVTDVSGPLAIIIGRLPPEKQQELCKKLGELK